MLKFYEALFVGIIWQNTTIPILNQCIAVASVTIRQQRSGQSLMVNALRSGSGPQRDMPRIPYLSYEVP